MTPQRITTREAAELLGRPNLARLLKPFMRGPKTVGEVAAAQGMTVEALHYRVGQFHRAGLLRVVGERPRRGRASKLYEAVATDFVFSVDLLKPDTLRALSTGESWRQEFLEELERATTVHQQRTVRVFLKGNGALMWGTLDEPASEEEVPGTFFTQSAALYLTPAEAAELANELEAINRKYEGRKGPRRYGMILGLTPLSRPVD